MRATMIVLKFPLFNDVLRFFAIRKHPAVQAIRTKSAIKAFNKWILPWAAGFDIEGMTVAVTQPFLNGISNEFRSIVATQVIRAAAHEKKPFQNLNDLSRRNAASHMNGQALAG